MFRVIEDKYVQNGYLRELDDVVHIENVYDVKMDYETNEIKFLFYNGKWEYKPAINYVPVKGGVSLL
jgi:hypothetical protein